MFLQILLSIFAGHAFQISCKSGNPANPQAPETRTYEISGDFAAEKETEEFRFGSAQLLRTITRSDGTKRSRVLIEEIPCAFSKKSQAFSCALTEDLSQGKLVTAKLHVKTYLWEFVRWQEGAPNQRDIPKLIQASELHFFIENQRYRNEMGERQPLVMTKRFKRNKCQISW